MRRRYRDLQVRWRAWRGRNSPGYRTCAHGRAAGWDYLDGGWWHLADWSACQDGQEAPPLPPRVRRLSGPHHAGSRFSRSISASTAGSASSMR